MVGNCSARLGRFVGSCRGNSINLSESQRESTDDNYEAIRLMSQNFFQMLGLNILFVKRVLF